MSNYELIKQAERQIMALACTLKALDTKEDGIPVGLTDSFRIMNNLVMLVNDSIEWHNRSTHDSLPSMDCDI